MRHSTLLTFCFFALVLIVTATPLQAAQPDSRPNILFLLTDDQSNTALGCAGNPILKTPTIDDLAANGVRFSNAFVTTSICAASRASIWTGLFERSHNYTFLKPPIKKEIMLRSYPALLHKAGYRTGFIGKYGIRTEGEPESEMFDFYKFHMAAFFQEPDRHETELCGDRAVEFLKENPAGKPFCLSISIRAPHAIDEDHTAGDGQFPCPKAMEGMYEDAVIPPPRLSDPAIFESQPDFLKKSMNRERYFWRWDTPEEYQANMRAHYRMITGIDTVIARIRKALKDLKLDSNTVIIFMGDNGLYMGNRGFAGKWSHYEESLRVPLVIYDPRLPKKKRGRVEERMALNIDIAPTILEIAGVEAPEQYQGRSLVPLIQDKSGIDWRKDFFCEHLMEKDTIPKWEGVRGERYVYARYFGQKPVFEFLHDLKTDPDQLVNLASNPKYKDILERMRKRCDKLIAECGDPGK